MFIPADLWFRAFVLTVAVELPIAYVVLRRWAIARAGDVGAAPGASAGRGRLLALIVLANLASHPAVWFILSQPLRIGTVEYAAVVETWAVAVEALLFWVAIRGLPPRWAVIASFAANAASFLVGRLVAAIWPDLMW